MPNVSTSTIPTPNIATPANLTAQMIAAGELSEILQAIYYPASIATNDIIAAANQAAITGGFVQLPPGQIPITAPLPLLPGVIYLGSAFAYNLAGQVAPANPIAAGSLGTVLIAATPNSYPCFWDSKSDRAAPYGTSTLMTAQYIIGCGVKNVQISGFSYGIKCGGLFEASVAWSVFEHISTVGCGWGTWFENADSCTFRDISNNNYINGAHWHVSSGTTLINLGDSLVERLIFNGGSSTNVLSRNVVFGSHGPGFSGSNMNGMCIQNVGGVNNALTFVSNTVSIPASGSSITLTSGNTSSYALGEPVSFSTTTSSTPALNQQQIYFIQSIIDGTHFTLSNIAFSTTAITFSGSSSGTMIARGFAGMEIIGYGDGSTVSSSSFVNCGSEAQGAMAYLIQGIQGSGGAVDIQLEGAITATTGVTGGSTHIQNIVGRNNGQGLRLTIDAPCNSVDFDQSCQFISVAGYQSNQYQQGYTGVGVLAPPSGFVAGVFLTGSLGGGVQTVPYAPDFSVNASTGFIHFSNRAVAMYQQAQGTGDNWNVNQGNQITFLTAAGGTFVLPTPGSSTRGTWVVLCNPQTNTITVTVTGGGNIVGGGASTASFTHAAQTVRVYYSTYDNVTDRWMVL